MTWMGDNNNNNNKQQTWCDYWQMKVYKGKVKQKTERERHLEDSFCPAESPQISVCVCVFVGLFGFCVRVALINTTQQQIVWFSGVKFSWSTLNRILLLLSSNSMSCYKRLLVIVLHYFLNIYIEINKVYRDFSPELLPDKQFDKQMFDWWTCKTCVSQLQKNGPRRLFSLSFMVLYMDQTPKRIHFVTVYRFNLKMY